MASTNVNPLVVTSTGAVYHDARPVRITGIIINASADTWSVILKDSNGNIIFQATDPLVNDRFRSVSFAKPVEVSAIYATTLTSITNVLIYIDPV